MAYTQRGGLISRVLLFPLLLLLPGLLLRCELAAGDNLGILYVRCTLNVTSLTTTFSRNLGTALGNLTTLSSQGSMYATTTAGSGAAGVVYAVFQCRGDLTHEQCGQCIQNATVRLAQQECRESVGARIQLEGCYVRYENQSFFVLDTSEVLELCNTAKVSDAVGLAAINDVMEDVTSQAPKQGGFATASESFEYALAQCLGYLNESDCSDCLSAVPYRTVCDSAQGMQVHLTSCFYRYESYTFFQALSPPPAPAPAPAASPPGLGSVPPLASSPAIPEPKPPGSKKTGVVGLGVGVGVGVAILIASLCAVVAWRYKSSKLKGDKRVNKAPSWPPQLLQTKAQVFSLEELEEATGHFHPTNKLGTGGFGIVYKGTLLSGEEVAIKKLSIERQDRKEEFLNEVSLITSVQHKNLIRLLGCCVEGSERILVYEYLPNKSLDFYLYGENKRLNWATRYGIILGMAKGLAYLHEESHIRIIHRDIKPSNILLDDQLNPIIADFGVARLVKENATHFNTRVAGTIGYLAPEYAIFGDLSEKVDVFSFGLVCLEILTGKQNKQTSLLTWVWENYQQGKLLNLVDEKLGDAFSPDEAIRVVHVALLCTQENAQRRPAMSMVTLLLSGTSDILDVPTRPAFLDRNDIMPPMVDGNNQFTSTSSTSPQSTESGGKALGLSANVQSYSEFIDPR